MTVFSTDEVARQTGVSHRQLDYGYRTGSLHPTGGRCGSGSRLAWSLHEVAVIRRLAEVAKELPFVDFGQLARCHAATLRSGKPAVIVCGNWGRFEITAPDTDTIHTDDSTDPVHLAICIIDHGNGTFGVQCACGFSTKNRHSYSSAIDTARGHNKGTHDDTGLVEMPARSVA